MGETVVAGFPCQEDLALLEALHVKLSRLRANFP
ncbi:hypothetical protein FHY25_002168 [Xanthomonas arboricola]|nr:hypothetical protein [Xanthomonas campestris]MCW2007587.1 hypothetical protein [Xanthomonas campestris]